MQRVDFSVLLPFKDQQYQQRNEKMQIQQCQQYDNRLQLLLEKMEAIPRQHARTNDTELQIHSIINLKQTVAEEKYNQVAHQKKIQQNQLNQYLKPVPINIDLFKQRKVETNVKKHPKRAISPIRQTQTTVAQEQKIQPIQNISNIPKTLVNHSTQQTHQLQHVKKPNQHSKQKQFLLETKYVTSKQFELEQTQKMKKLQKYYNSRMEIDEEYMVNDDM